MKCPNCGREIPEDHLYCDFCGTEIKVVPEYNPEVENKIDESINGLVSRLTSDDGFSDDGEFSDDGGFSDDGEFSDDGGFSDENDFSGNDQDDNLKRRFCRYADSFMRLVKRHPVRSIAVIVGAALLLAIALFSDKGASTKDYVSMAKGCYTAGKTAEAEDYLEKAYEIDKSDPEIVFLLASYYRTDGEYEKAASTLNRIIDSAAFDRDTLNKAGEEIISIYESQKEYSKAQAFLLESDDEDLMNKYHDDYFPEEPVMEPLGKDFEEETEITISDTSSGKIYYTVNGISPTEKSTLYTSAIKLSEEGKYTIKAVLINKRGLMSDVATEEYSISFITPAAPEIMEDSGSYDQNTQIVAVADDECRIYYTDDGSIPDNSSKLYSSPIAMPYGETTYKFIAYDSEGHISDVTTRHYKLSYTRLVTQEQAVASIINALVKQNVLIDASGKVLGKDGINQYTVDDIITISGHGEYYAISEFYRLGDGTTTKTGYMYAVNTHDGTLCRLSYDSSGNYFVVKMSGS